MTFAAGLMARVARHPRRWRRTVAVVVLASVPVCGTWAQQAPFEDYLAGKLLLATPEMPDPRFTETVILMVKHDASGAMGLVLNRPMGEIPVASLLEELGIEGVPSDDDIRLFYGGPVEVGRGLVLHSPDYSSERTVAVTDEVSLTAEQDILRAIATGAGPRQSLVTFGYAGWTAGQLEAEIANGGWVSVPADTALIFDNDYDAKWRRAMQLFEIEL